MQVPRSLSFAEVKEQIDESMLRNLIESNFFEISCTTRINAAGMRFSLNVCFVSKGEDKYYYGQSFYAETNRNTRNVINGNQ